MSKKNPCTQGDNSSTYSHFRVDGMRVAIEIIVAICHFISFLIIVFNFNAEGILWTLFTLCITTFNTVIQFQHESGWRIKGSLLFAVPFVAILAIMVFIFASLFIEPLCIVTENQHFAWVVSFIVFLRQSIQAVLIFRIYIEKKGKEG